MRTSITTICYFSDIQEAQEFCEWVAGLNEGLAEILEANRGAVAHNGAGVVTVDVVAGEHAAFDDQEHAYRYLSYVAGRFATTGKVSVHDFTCVSGRLQ